MSHLGFSFLKGFRMLENQYVDKKIRQFHNHKTSPFDLQPLELILNTETDLHSLKYLVVIVQRSPENAQFRTSILRCCKLCRLSFTFKMHSKGCKSNGEAL